MKKKILYILGTLNAGGTENYVLRFINYCGNQEFEWHVLSLEEKKSDLDDQFLKAGCNIIYQSISYFNPVKFWKFYRLVKREKFDTVCTFNGNFGGIPQTIARIAGVQKRIVWHRRSSNAFGNNIMKRAYNGIVNLLIRINATKILSNSQHALNVFYGKYQKNDERFKVIPNGVNQDIVKTKLTKSEARKKYGISDDVFLVGHVGRYNPAKNHHTIFKVAQKLQEKELGIHFLFCGSGTDSNDFKKKIQQHGIEDICHCLGLVDDVAAIYKSLDLFYFPSVTEGQPNALIEAMLTGVPVLPSNIPPILEVLPDKSKKNCCNATDVYSSVESIISIIQEEVSKDTFIYQMWAQNKFDDKINFEMFKKTLD